MTQSAPRSHHWFREELRSFLVGNDSLDYFYCLVRLYKVQITLLAQCLFLSVYFASWALCDDLAQGDALGPFRQSVETWWAWLCLSPFQVTIERVPSQLTFASCGSSSVCAAYNYWSRTLWCCLSMRPSVRLNQTCRAWRPSSCQGSCGSGCWAWRRLRRSKYPVGRLHPRENPLSCSQFFQSRSGRSSFRW